MPIEKIASFILTALDGADFDAVQLDTVEHVARQLAHEMAQDEKERFLKLCELEIV